MIYADKLKEFNSTQKYMREYNFLTSLIGGYKQKILDYGCGTGMAADRLNKFTNHAVSGYDIFNYNSKFTYVIDIVDVYDTIYFMHSIAHILSLDQVLNKLKRNLAHQGTIIVITPNKDWLELNKNPDYIPDKTVVQHFNIKELQDKFESLGFYVTLVGQFGEISGNINERIFLVAKWVQ